MSFPFNIGPGEKGRLKVSGGPLVPLLLDTSKATAMGFYDQYGSLNAVIYRVFDDDMWAFATKKDLDWKAALSSLGIDQ